jgi:tight adherence protein C
VVSAAAAAPALAFLGASLGVAGMLLLAPRGIPRPGGSGLLRVLAVAGERLRSRQAGVPLDLEARIAAAGRPAGLGARELMAAKVAAAMLAGVLGAMLAAPAPGRLGLVLVPAGPAAGFLAPDLWLVRRAAERARRVRRELPTMLDLLRITVEAGGSLPAALESVGRRARGGLLAAEWRAVGGEVALGVPLREALRGMAERLPQQEVQALVASLERAVRHGTPLGDALGAHAHDARFALRRRVREEAARAGPKIQLVVALLLVPSVLLVVAAALAAALLDSGSRLLPV